MLLESVCLILCAIPAIAVTGAAQTFHPDTPRASADEDVVIVVELKAVMGVLGHAEVQQLRNYMDLPGVRQGLLLKVQQPGKNQGVTELEVRKLKAKAADAACVE